MSSRLDSVLEFVRRALIEPIGHLGASLARTVGVIFVASAATAGAC